MLTIATFIAGLFGITDVFKVQKWIKIGLIIFAVFIALAICWRIYRFINPKPVLHIDQSEVAKINAADEKTRKAELQNQIEKNQDVIKTTDGRTEIQNINAVEKNREIDAKVAEADKAVQAAKAQGHDVTEDELACLLIPENCTK